MDVTTDGPGATPYVLWMTVDYLFDLQSRCDVMNQRVPAQLSWQLGSIAASASHNVLQFV